MKPYRLLVTETFIRASPPLSRALSIARVTVESPHGIIPTKKKRQAFPLTIPISSKDREEVRRDAGSAPLLVITPRLLVEAQLAVNRKKTIKKAFFLTAFLLPSNKPIDFLNQSDSLLAAFSLHKWYKQNNKDIESISKESGYY